MTSSKSLFLFITQLLYMEKERVRLIIPKVPFSINNIGFEAKYRKEHYILSGLTTYFPF